MRADFRLGDWIVRPRRDCIERGDGIVHIHSKPMAVLECLAAAGGEVVTRDELFDTVWPGVIVTDDALTQCVVELRKAFGDPAHNAQIIRTVARRGFCLVPPVIYLTEAEMAAADKQGQADAGVFGTMKRSRWASLVGAVVIVLALAAYWYLDKPREVVLVSPVPSIAVLPFADMSEGRDQAYFADGLSEELLNHLAHIQGLRVTSRTSSFYFRDRNEELEAIAETLGVRYLLEGSVRKDGNQLRITAQLLDASDGFHLWSESYDRQLEGIFAVQDEIAEAIVGALQKPLGLQLEAPRRVTTTSTEAHDAYLRGRYLVSHINPAAVQGAVQEFETAIALDPEYALAHADLAAAIVLQTSRSYGELTKTEALARAAPHAERAMALDPILAEAHHATARVKSLQGRYIEAQEYFLQAIRINPNYARAYNNYGVLLARNFGRYAESFEMHEAALRLDPLLVAHNNNHLDHLIQRNRLAEAERHIKKYESIDLSRYTRMLGRLRSVEGRWSKYLLGRLEAKRIDSEPWRPDFSFSSSATLAILGLDREALAYTGQTRLLATLLRLLGRPEEAVISAEASLAEDPTDEDLQALLGLALAAAGEYARARPFLEEAWRQSSGLVTSWGIFTSETAAALFAARRDAGEAVAADELVAALRDNVRRYREAGITATSLGLSPDFQAGLADYLSGERDSGLALIAKAAEEGYFILPNEAYLRTLYDDPGFLHILAGQQARQTRERHNFLEVACNDTRYAKIWQPAEGTCERYAEEVGG
jgi:TolB-like protein/DNA-binding winged helix-turn-helix (wHTH) protein/Flp pilus assembly protein TadD